MTDEPDTAELENRIDELEETIQRMLPNRREVIGMAGAGLAGAGLMSGTASAGSSSVGTIGNAPNDLVDIEAEDVTIQDTLNNASISGAAAGEAIQSDGSGNLQFGAVEAVQEVSTFGNLPAIDPPQLAFVTDESEYYHSEPESGTAFDIADATFRISINTQDSSPTGIAFNDDGSRLYEVGGSNDKIYQSSLSTPFDIASATFSKSINTQDSSSTALAFNTDGTRLYEMGIGSDRIYQSSLSTPFDIASASFQKSINTQDGTPTGITFNNDGTRLYEVGLVDKKILESSLSTPFDIASASLSKSINTQDSSPRGIAFNADGSRLYEVGTGGDNIYQYQVVEGGWVAF